MNISKKNPIIGLDVDGVLCDIASTIISTYNYMSICQGEPPFTKGDTYSVEDIDRYDIADLIGRDCFYEVAKIMQKKKACMLFPLYDGAVDLYKNLKEIGDVVIVTKPFSIYKDWYTERNFWLKKHFEIETEDVIYAARKYLINTDIIIDDAPDILEKWLHFTNKPAIKIERPWNKNYQRYGLSCAKNINEIPNLVKELIL